MHGRTTHGLSKTPEYRVWSLMKSRCENKNSSGYFKYGAKGIKVCHRWRKFETFFVDMGERPSPKHSIDRIDSSKGYFQKNCRWATAEQQNNNRGNNKHCTINGVTKTIGQWCRFFRIGDNTVWNRIRRGWSFEKAVSTAIPKFPLKYCRNGHKFSGKNQVFDYNGKRRCKICCSIYKKKYRQDNLQALILKDRNYYKSKVSLPKDLKKEINA